MQVSFTLQDRNTVFIYTRKVYITMNKFLINLEVLTCVNQSFLKILIQFIIKFGSTVLDFLRRVLRKEQEFQRSRKITVDELYDSRECSGYYVHRKDWRTLSLH